jgi:asparagine synthase (glutamine-hydrolysing)
MCGIAGYLGKDGDSGTLHAMAEHLHHRGPDASGVWHSPDGMAGLAHTRLAIIDLSPNAAQPMQNNDGTLAVAFNGEIYNFADLKKELSFYPFKSHSDTEVILAAYQAWGIGAFTRMRGMFAIALYDARKREMVLVRDRLGKKPLYWTITKEGTLVFGSELKALLVHPATPNTIDYRSVAHYLAREYVPTPRTIYADVHKLSPGTILRYQNDSVHIEPFWNPSAPADERDITSALAHFDSLLTQATRERMVSDVPLGVFLSGGIDSSTVAYYASQVSNKKIKTFSIGFTEKSFDESSQARLVAERLGTDHHEHVLSGKEALDLLQDIPTVFDEPVADASVLPTLLLSRFTREHVTVALGGDGADETLLGYPTFKAEQYAELYMHIPQAIRTLFELGSDLLPPSQKYMAFDFKVRTFTQNFNTDPMARHLEWLGSFKEAMLKNILLPPVQEVADGITTELITQWRKESPDLKGLNALSHLYLRTYLLDQVLVKVDRASMRYGLEVRAPFLSHDVVQFLLSLPANMKYRNGRGKYLLRMLMHERLPLEIIDRPKKGFAVPVATWLRTDLKELATDVLSPTNIQKTGLLNVTAVSRLLEEHLANTRNHGKKLWTLLVLQLWYDSQIAQ